MVHKFTLNLTDADYREIPKIVNINTVYCNNLTIQIKFNFKKTQQIEAH